MSQSFQNPRAIDYIVFLSDSGFLAGYTRFNEPGNWISIPATTGVQYGWFPMMECAWIYGPGIYKIVAFTVTGPYDGQVLDGLPSPAEYIKWRGLEMCRA